MTIAPNKIASHWSEYTENLKNIGTWTDYFWPEIITRNVCAFSHKALHVKRYDKVAVSHVVPEIWRILLHEYEE